MKEVEEALGERFIFCGDDFSSFGQHGEDIIYVRTGGTEGIFKSLGLCKPGLQDNGCFRLLTSGRSNSLAASMEILAYLEQMGLKGEILHGSAEHIAGRIKSAADGLSDSVSLLGCARRAHVLTGESPETARQWEGHSQGQGCPS